MAAPISSFTVSEKPIAAASTDVLAMQLIAAQDQLDALQEQLTESQRLATIGTIAAVIAHEFNNLLTPSSATRSTRCKAPRASTRPGADPQGAGQGVSKLQQGREDLPVDARPGPRRVVFLRR
jgi:hypothetical protein